MSAVFYDASTSTSSTTDSLPAKPEQVTLSYHASTSTPSISHQLPSKPEHTSNILSNGPSPILFTVAAVQRIAAQLPVGQVSSSSYHEFHMCCWKVKLLLQYLDSLPPHGAQSNTAQLTSHLVDITELVLNTYLLHFYTIAGVWHEAREFSLWSVAELLSAVDEHVEKQGDYVLQLRMATLASMLFSENPPLVANSIAHTLPPAAPSTLINNFDGASSILPPPASELAPHDSAPFTPPNTTEIHSPNPRETATLSVISNPAILCSTDAHLNGLEPCDLNSLFESWPTDTPSAIEPTSSRDADETVILTPNTSLLSFAGILPADIQVSFERKFSTIYIEYDSRD
ncbi:hypothetical protein C8R46DRAFT_1210925 [Mycena filopes]|nr:hypothetical protein C8R46DRAFT_1210925 [Mycena filopes]